MHPSVNSWTRVSLRCQFGEKEKIFTEKNLNA